MKRSVPIDLDSQLHFYDKKRKLDEENSTAKLTPPSSTNPSLEQKLIEQYQEEQRQVGRLRALLSMVDMKELKEILVLNKERTSGSREELIDRCSFGMFFGKLPRCTSPHCINNYLEFQNGKYVCTGMNSQTAQKCNYSVSVREIQTEEWLVYTDTNFEFLNRYKFVRHQKCDYVPSSSSSPAPPPPMTPSRESSSLPYATPSRPSSAAPIQISSNPIISTPTAPSTSIPLTSRSITQTTVITRTSHDSPFNNETEIMIIRSKIKNKAYPFSADHIYSLAKLVGAIDSFASVTAQAAWEKLKQHADKLERVEFVNGELKYSETVTILNWNSSMQNRTATTTSSSSNGNHSISMEQVPVEELIKRLPQRVQNALPISIATDQKILQVLVEEFQKSNTNTVSSQNVNQLQITVRENEILKKELETTTNKLNEVENSFQQYLQASKQLIAKFESSALKK